VKPTAKIRIVHDLGTSLIGVVTEHPSQDQFILGSQHTSRIVARHADGTIETENTIYTVVE